MSTVNQNEYARGNCMLHCLKVNGIKKVIKKYDFFSPFGSNPRIFGRLCQRIDVRVSIDDSGIII